jgi:predicted AAA+ superfamily ATPase
MYRFKFEELKKWKNSNSRKPLIIHGARQVGKTWLVKEFGRQNYQKVAHIDFTNNVRMATLFEQDLDPQRLLQGLKAESGVEIEPDNTLIILDEIQSVPKALTALKYFYEQLPEYHLVVAGSLLGLAVNQSNSFPVGKVDFSTLYPLSFQEFLLAQGEEQLLKLLDSKDFSLIATFRSKYIQLLKTYYFVGGMPEAVDKYIVTKSWQKVREVQQNILKAYESDFGKHAPLSLVPRIRQVWQNIPAQLAKENKKYIYGLIREGARAKEYELALTWLEDAGLIYRVARVESPKIPLRAYQSFTAFKIYMVDVGLLAAMTDLDAKTLLEGNSIFTQFKGALTEQYALEELKVSQKNTVAYWSRDEGSSAEVDFLIQYDKQIIPIEVKAQESSNSKSLRIYHGKYQPKYSIRTSMADYRQDDWLTNIPLYLISRALSLISSKQN